MKVLITGGCGFIGSYVADKFYREGYDVYIIDNLCKGKKNKVKTKHKFYKLNVEDARCEEVFKSNDFNVVIHLASISFEKDIKDKPILGMKNIIELCAKYDVKKFIYVSSTEVYGDATDSILTEDSKTAPITLKGINILSEEKYCEFIKDEIETQINILRISNVYGPKSDSNNIINVHMENNVDEKLASKKEDYIYIGDAVEAIYRAVEFCKEFKINITSGEFVSTNELKRIIDSVRNNTIANVDSYESLGLISNTRAKIQLNWSPKYTLYEGLKITFEWYRKYFKSDKYDYKRSRVSKRDKVLPYIENIVSFLLVAVIKVIMDNQGIDIAIDISLIYIATIAINYGMNQGILAILLSTIMYFMGLSNVGYGFWSLIYNPNTLLDISMYIFIGCVLGHIIDNRKAELEEKDIEYEKLRNKFDFMYELYGETLKSKKELEYQISTSKDSFGKIYRITETLNSFTPENIFGESIKVVEEIMQSKEICIFKVSKEEKFLRLISKSAQLTTKVHKSIPVDGNETLKEIIVKKELFVNKKIEKGLPDMMYPIVINDKVIAIIAIFKMDFEEITLYKQNLFNVLCNLISSALGRAYNYEEAIENRKYLNGTEILTNEYFQNVLESKQVSKELNHSDFVVLKINNYTENIYANVRNAVRDEDYLGCNVEGDVCILLSNTKKEEAKFVMERLKHKNIITSIVE